LLDVVLHRFLTEEALSAIGETTRRNIEQVFRGEDCPNRLV